MLKLFAALAIIAVVSAVPLGKEDLPAIDHSIIEAVNAANSTWTAGVNSRFIGYTLRDIKCAPPARRRRKRKKRPPPRCALG